MIFLLVLFFWPIVFLYFTLAALWLMVRVAAAVMVIIAMKLQRHYELHKTKRAATIQ